MVHYLLACRGQIYCPVMVDEHVVWASLFAPQKNDILGALPTSTKSA